MSRQDRQGVRTAAELERKYDFAKGFAEVMGVARDSQETAMRAANTAKEAKQAAEEAKRSATTIELFDIDGGIKVKITDKEGEKWLVIPGGTIEKSSYSVTNNLTDVTTNNTNVVVSNGERYSAILTPTIGKITSIVVTMGGKDVTGTVYSNGVITIPSVTGDIVITAIAVSVPLTYYNVTNRMTNVDTNNTNVSVVGGESYTAILTSNANTNTIDAVIVTMGGEDITSQCVTKETNATKVFVPNVTGDISIIAIAVDEITPDEGYYSVKYVLVNIPDCESGSEQVFAGDPYSISYSYFEGELHTFTVTMDGVDVTGDVMWEVGAGLMIGEIGSVTGNVVITAIVVVTESEV